jgi:hypothetical protein
MPDWLKALIAGYGAKKLGGGCFSTILIFVVIYYALGQCNHPAAVRHSKIKASTENHQTVSIKNKKPVVAN